MENWGAAELRALFGGSADVAERQIMAGGQKLDVLFLDGLTSGGDIAEQVLRPLMQTVQPGSMQAVLAQAEQARVYCAVAERVTAPEDAADKLLHGYCVVVFPGTGAALCFETKTDTRRGPSAPESENTVKGAKDAFTETMRINTSLLRRHLRSAQLRFVQKTVGLRSQTAVTVCFLADLTDLIQLHCLTGKIHRNDSFCLLRDMAADALRVDVVGVTLYISKYRRSAAIQNAVGGSSKRQGGYDYLIPFRNARRHRSQMQRRRSVADHNDIVCPGYFAQTLLQLCHLRSTGERIAAQHICNRFYVRIINILVPIGNRCLPNRLPAKNC